MSSKVEVSEIETGYTHIESVNYILGIGTLKKVVIKGGHHPKMRLLTAEASTALITATGPSEEASFAVPVAWTATGHQLECIHKNGVVAGETIAAAAANNITPFIMSNSTYTDADVFEASEDVILQAATAGNAATATLIVLKFEVVG